MKINTKLLVLYSKTFVYLHHQTITDTKTLSTMKTYASIEKNLKELGFTTKMINCKLCVFETSELVAYVYYLGTGRGFDCDVLEKETEPIIAASTDDLIRLLKHVKECEVKKEKLSQKFLNCSPMNSGYDRYNKMSTQLNWACMELEKARTNFARAFKGSDIDVDTSEKTYKPSGFHEYKH